MKKYLLLIFMVPLLLGWKVGVMDSPAKVGGMVPSKIGGMEIGIDLSYVSSSDNSAGASTTVVVTAPAGIQDGDILLAFFMIEDENATDTPPTGFIEIDLSTTTATTQQWSYYKIASSESGNYTFTSSATDNLSANIVVFRKTSGTWTAPTTVGYHNENDATTQTTLTSGNVTTQDNSILVISWCTSQSAGTVNTAPSGMTLVTTIDGTGTYQHTYREAIVTGGAGVNRTIILNGSTGEMTSTAVVLYAT